MYKINNMQLENGAQKKKTNSKKWLRVKFNYEKFQKTPPTHLDQHTEGQTLIQRTGCNKDT